MGIKQEPEQTPTSLLPEIGLWLTPVDCRLMPVTAIVASNQVCHLGGPYSCQLDGFMVPLSPSGIGCSSTLTSMTPLRPRSARQWVLHRVLHTSRSTLKKQILSWVPRLLASTSTTRVLGPTCKPSWRRGTRCVVTSAWRFPSPKGSEIVGPKRSLVSALTIAWDRELYRWHREDLCSLDRSININKPSIKLLKLIHDAVYAVFLIWNCPLLGFEVDTPCGGINTEVLWQKWAGKAGAVEVK